QALSPRWSLLLSPSASLPRCRRVLAATVTPGLLWQPAAFPKEPDEVVANELELLLPQQRKQIIPSVRLEIPRAVDGLQQPGDLLLLHAAPERERPHAILEQSPSEALALGELLIDHLVFPKEVGLRHREYQLVSRRPDALKGGLKTLGRPLVHRIV